MLGRFQMPELWRTRRHSRGGRKWHPPMPTVRSTIADRAVTRRAAPRSKTPRSTTPWFPGCHSRRTHRTPKTDGVATCISCGFEGLMQYDSDRGDTICPACLTVSRSRPERGQQIVDCPNCRQPIEVHEKDRGKTIVCPAVQLLRRLRAPVRKTTLWRTSFSEFGARHGEKLTPRFHPPRRACPRRFGAG